MHNDVDAHDARAYVTAQVECSDTMNPFESESRGFHYATSRSDLRHSDSNQFGVLQLVKGKQSVSENHEVESIE